MRSLRLGDMRVALASTFVSKSKARVQYAALPWRMNRGRLEVLLITTLKTHRWIVPKGWPVETLSPQACAAHEALEEAGVRGTVSQQPVGEFRYVKRRKDGDAVPCHVHVFALEVTQQRRSWAEKGAREIRWCSIEDALAAIGEPGLRQVIARFAETMESLVH
jgi:8-oxo-dGTP pyrophosphatase MutT (NUDIX family)